MTTIRRESVPPDTEIVLSDTPEVREGPFVKRKGGYVVATFIGGRPAFAGHHQRLDEAERDFERRVTRRKEGF
jgi:hypothetical protein